MNQWSITRYIYTIDETPFSKFIYCVPSYLTMRLHTVIFLLIGSFKFTDPKHIKSTHLRPRLLYINHLMWRPILTKCTTEMLRHSCVRAKTQNAHFLQPYDSTHSSRCPSRSLIFHIERYSFLIGPHFGALWWSQTVTTVLARHHLELSWIPLWRKDPRHIIRPPI